MPKSSMNFSSESEEHEANIANELGELDIMIQFLLIFQEHFGTKLETCRLINALNGISL